MKSETLVPPESDALVPVQPDTLVPPESDALVPAEPDTLVPPEPDTLVLSSDDETQSPGHRLRMFWKRLEISFRRLVIEGFGVEGDPDHVKDVVDTFERIVRWFLITAMIIAGLLIILRLA